LQHGVVIVGCECGDGVRAGIEREVYVTVDQSRHEPHSVAEVMEKRLIGWRGSRGVDGSDPTILDQDHARTHDMLAVEQVSSSNRQRRPIRSGAGIHLLTSEKHWRELHYYRESVTIAKGVQAVKRRGYDNSRRLAQSRATRAEVVAAAHRLFIERGYAGTTIDAIGEEAEVPLATVYRLFGSKRGILASVMDVAFGGDDEPIAFKDRPSVQAALAEPVPTRLVERFAHIARELLDRSAPMQEVLRGAANSDAEAADMLSLTRQQRLNGQSRIAEALAERHALAAGIDQAMAADIVYVLMSPDVYRVLTVERSWSADQYEEWLAAALCALLLSEPAHLPDARVGLKLYSLASAHSALLLRERRRLGSSRARMDGPGDDRPRPGAARDR
jgi:AcrR family transcriptional regulator